MMQPSGNAVPECPKMFGVPAADILTATFILRRTKRSEEIVIRKSREGTVVVDGSLTHDSWFVNVVILEGVVGFAVCDPVAIVMAACASGAARVHFRRENLFAARDEGLIGSAWKLR